MPRENLEKTNPPNLSDLCKISPALDQLLNRQEEADLIDVIHDAYNEVGLPDSNLNISEIFKKIFLRPLLGDA